MVAVNQEETAAKAAFVKMLITSVKTTHVLLQHQELEYVLAWVCWASRAASEVVQGTM